MAEHTPTPWQVGYESKSIIHEVPGMADGCEYFNVAVLSRHSLMSKEAADANAAFIFRAVNSHDVLVKALKPFAFLCEMHIKPSMGDSMGLIFPGPKACIHVADLRAAKIAYDAALASAQREEG